MSERCRPASDREPGRYEIRLKGHLDARWAAWFDGLSLTHESDGTTIIHGPVVDQAALHGLLQKSARHRPAADLGHSGRARPADTRTDPDTVTPRKEHDMTTTVHTPAATRAADGPDAEDRRSSRASST